MTVKFNEYESFIETIFSNSKFKLFLAQPIKSSCNFLRVTSN